MQIVWSSESRYIEGTTTNFKFKSKIASFDLDDTVVKVKSGKKFAENENDWVLLNSQVKPKLEELVKQDYCVIIISNQKGISTKDDEVMWKAKLNNINKELKIPLKVFASTNDDIYRKPILGFWDIIQKELVKEGIKYDQASTFYCGDACGRNGDHSDTDYKFALNANIKFYTPEELYLNDMSMAIKYRKPVHPVFQIDINSKFKALSEFKPSSEMVILVGVQGSGKSTYCATMLPNHTKINMDTLKTKAKCIKECEKVMLTKRNIVIDNTNPSVDARKVYIDLAKKHKYTVKCVVIECPEDLAKHNAGYRMYVSQGKSAHIPTICYRLYKKNYVEPKLTEGIDEIVKSPPQYFDNSTYNLYYA